MMIPTTRAVLIVTPEAELREFLQYFFRIHGWIVDFPDDRVGPALKMSRGVYECAAVDYDLPVGDGIEFIESLRFSGNFTPALLVSRILPAAMLASRTENLVNTFVLDQPYSLERLRDTCARLMSLTWIRRRRAGA